MWGIVLTDAAGTQIDQVTAHVPSESLRGWSRRLVETQQEEARARVISADQLFEYAHPEDGQADAQP